MSAQFTKIDAGVRTAVQYAVDLDEPIQVDSPGSTMSKYPFWASIITVTTTTMPGKDDIVDYRVSGVRQDRHGSIHATPLVYTTSRPVLSDADLNRVPPQWLLDLVSAAESATGPDVVTDEVWNSRIDHFLSVAAKIPSDSPDVKVSIRRLINSIQNARQRKATPLQVAMKIHDWSVVPDVDDPESQTLLALAKDILNAWKV